MKRTCGIGVVVMLLLAVTVAAHAVDLVPYMGLKAGKWNQFLRIDSCGNPLDDAGMKVVSWNEYFLWKNYTKTNGSWVYHDSVIVQATLTKFKFIGHLDGNETWLYTPAIAIPRNLALNTPFFYKGSLINQSTQESKPVVWTVLMTESELTITTPAQTYTDCIKVLTNEVTGGEVNGGIHFMCSGRGEVKSYDLKTENKGDAELPVNAFMRMKDLKAFGNTRAPF